MIELTAENALAYLRERGWISADAATVEPLSGGVSNQVLRVSAPGRLFVLKQSRPQLRTRDAWFSDLERIWRECDVMKALGPLLPGTVPEVLFVDRENYAYAMSHAPLHASTWKTDLLAGKIDIAIGERAGRVLALIHEVSAHNADFAVNFSDHTVYRQLRIDPFYERIRERRPEVADAVSDIIQQMVTRKEALCHGDYTPKNFLVHESRFTLVDYETAHFGDPTMDLGLFTAHIMLKAIRLPTLRDDYHRLAEAFWLAYCQHVSFRPTDELERRGVQHLSVLLLARVDGTSPVDYLTNDEQRSNVRRLARMILRDGVDQWETIWSQLPCPT